METVQQYLITEEQIITPTVEILDRVTPGHNKPLTTENIPRTITQSLDELFPEQQYEEKDIQKAKEILGVLAENFTSEQLKDVASEIRFLAETWLDDFEREIFGDLTLKEMLHEKGGL